MAAVDVSALALMAIVRGHADQGQRPDLDHDSCLESVMLKGPTGAVRALADRIRAERGVRFNLDHGTDFATFVDGMPVNMRTHGHGQGYTDINFLIPETDLEVSYTDSRFTDDDPAGEEIPGAIPLVISAGLTARTPTGYLAAARVRYFSPYPLIEDDSVESDGSMVVNLRLGKAWDRVCLFVDVLNALDSDDHDIDYLYASRLAGEPDEGVEDLHFNIFQKRSARASLRYSF